jgi:serine phosphatase RsbU (regulator of sigma subunit)
VIARRFHSRRVWILHGLLLAAVLAVAYVSGAAQYQAIRDQRIEELRTQQQNWARTSGNLIEQNIRLLAVTLPDLEQRIPVESAIPDVWLRAVATFDRQTGDPTGATLRELSEVVPRVARHPDLLQIQAPTLRADQGEILLATPTRDQRGVRVALLSGEQISTELLAIKSRVLDAVSYLGVDDRTILTGGVPAKAVEAIITDPKLLEEVRSLIEAGSVGTPVHEPATNGELSLVTVQPLAPLPGARWFLLIKRDNVGEGIDKTLRPLVWQLVGGAVMMVSAVAIVLVSTTISLYRGRRRIERLRMDMLSRDLQKARSIQLKWLPAPVRRSDDYAIAAANEPAAHISGDFYNWFELPTDDHQPRRTALVLGDVSGHGLPAAFLMATTQLIIKNTLPTLIDPGACLGELNRQLCSLAYQGQFVTIMILVLDHDAGTLTIASAGQAPPLLKRDGRVSSIELDPQLVVGVDPSTEYQTLTQPTQPGDQLVLFTDGVVETTNDAGEQFGDRRLIDAFRTAPDDPEKTLHSILGAIATHRQGNDPDDDLTLVALRLTPSESRKHPSPDEAAMV